MTGCSVPTEPMACAIDTVAAKLITSRRFQRLRRLTEDCGQASIYIASAIAKEFPARDLAYKDAVLKGDLDLATARISVNPSSGKSSHPGLTEEEKASACIAIARFYKMVYNFFVAMSAFLGPQLVSSMGGRYKYSIEEWHNIYGTSEAGRTATVDHVDYTGFCPAKLEDLDPNMQIRQSPSSDDTIEITGRVPVSSCKGLDPALSPDFSSALDNLYADKLARRGELEKRSVANQTEMNDALSKLYKVFTEDGNAKIPPTLSTFGGLPAGPEVGCAAKNRKASDPNYYELRPISGRLSGTDGAGLMKEYGRQVMELAKTNSAGQEKLVGLMSEVFKMKDDDVRGGEPTLVINPSLGTSRMEAIMKEARETIVDLVAKCQVQYVDAARTYELLAWTALSEKTKREHEENREKAAWEADEDEHETAAVVEGEAAGDGAQAPPSATDPAPDAAAVVDDDMDAADAADVVEGEAAADPADDAAADVDDNVDAGDAVGE